MHVTIGPTSVVTWGHLPFSLDGRAGTRSEGIAIVDSRIITSPSSYFPFTTFKKCCHPYPCNAYAPSSFQIDTQRPDNRSWLPQERFSLYIFCCLDMRQFFTRLLEMAVSLHGVLLPSVAEQGLIDIAIHQSPQVNGSSRKAVRPQLDEARLLRRYTFSKD